MQVYTPATSFRSAPPPTLVEPLEEEEANPQCAGKVCRGNSTGRPHCTKISSINIVISSLYGETKHQNNCKTQCEIPLGGYVSWCLKECVSAALTLIATPMLSLLVNRHNLNQPLTCAKVYHLPCPPKNRKLCQLYCTSIIYMSVESIVIFCSNYSRMKDTMLIPPMATLTTKTPKQPGQAQACSSWEESRSLGPCPPESVYTRWESMGHIT